MAATKVPPPPAWVDDPDAPVEAMVEIEEKETVEIETVGGDVMVVEEMDGTQHALVPATHHLIVGMGTLAAMGEAEFESKLAVMKKGQERIRIIQDQLLIAGEDYGKVQGISRPFLHQPGAEKLANFYGFAVRQEAERIPGDGIATPPLSYHVKSFVHLGDFSGPVIAMGYGEASSWEEKYRWRTAKPACPNCGREGLIRGRADGPLKGQWWCPGREGGCNRKFEPGVIPPAGKVENTDPYSLAETLIQMAGKRSFVAAIRRATGTSGLFTQDEDSPSVQAQSTETGTPIDAEVVVTEGAGVTTGRGASTEGPTQPQLAQLVRLSKEKDLGAPALASILGRLFGLSVAETGAAVSAAVKHLTAEQFGHLLHTIDTGEIEPAKETA